MRSIDKLLVGFVAGIVILVVAALLVDFNQPAAAYHEGTEPVDVAHNYLLALQEGDYERAYAQLSTHLLSYPQDIRIFIRQVRNESNGFPLDDGVVFNVLSSDVIDTWATVKVSESHFYNRSLFSSSYYSSDFYLDQELEDGVWKLVDGDLFFVDCWSKKTCPSF